MVPSQYFFDGLSQKVVTDGFDLLRFYSIRRKFVLVYNNMYHDHDHVSAKKRPIKLSVNGQILLLLQLNSHSLLCCEQ